MGSSVLTVFTDTDADPAALEGVRVAVLGYGNLGRPVALNLRDSGVDVLVGNRDDAFRRHATDDGFPAVPLADAAATADLVVLALPDEVVPEVYADAIAPGLRPGGALAVASGYPLAFGLLTPPPTTDVLMVAPRMLGEEIRRAYVDGTGFVAYVSVEQDASGQGQRRLLALARALGALRRGAIGLSAREEATLDLFVEQSVGPFLGTAFQLAFEVGVEAGLPPEVLVCELYMSGEMSRTIAAMAEQGFYRSVNGHGLVATFGGYLGTLEVDREAMLAHFRARMAEIREGEFARRLQKEQADGYPTVRLIEEFTAGGAAMTDAERELRRRLP